MPDWPPLPFVFDAVFLHEENRVLEFKEIKGANPVGAIANAADEHAVAFLNSEGGTVLWGVRNEDRVVVGVELSAMQKDELRRTVMNKLRGIQPPVDLTTSRLQFHPITGAKADHYVVELTLPALYQSDPFFTASGEVFVRVEGAKHCLRGPQLTAWIKTRAHRPTPTAGAPLDPALRALVARIRRIFAAHELEPAHLARFFKLRHAPFSIALTDLETDRTLLAWLEDTKLQWLADNLLLQREWIDGESTEIHRRHYFDKQPAKFFQTVAAHLDELREEKIADSPSAYFIRWGREKEWHTKGNSRVFVVVQIPIAQLSDERFVYKYVSDLEPYPWDYARTHIQLRAWARLLFVGLQMPCFGCDIRYADGNRLFNDEIFLNEVIEPPGLINRHVWHPDDHALSAKESRVAKDTETLPAVLAFLREHQLPAGEPE